MKEIGEKLKEARESMGITIEEAAEDLKLETSQIENLEEGNMEIFKDIYYLKYLIRDYAKYLGLDKEDLVNEFNEYLFDYTSKISMEDIKSAKELINEEVKIKSPYTIERKNQSSLIKIISYIVVVTVLIMIIVFVINEVTKEDDDIIENMVTNVGGCYELV